MDRSSRTSNKKRGGGVLVAIRNDCGFQCKRREDMETDIEILWVEVSLTNHSRLFVSAVYLPPDSNLDILSKLELSLDIVAAVIGPYDNVLMCGDFNMPDIQWEGETSGVNTKPRYCSTSKAEKFMGIVYENNLFQYVSTPTRGNNFLDLVFSSVDSVIVQPTENAVTSDHTAVAGSFNIDHRIKPDLQNQYVYNYRKADYAHIRRLLQCIPWSILKSFGCVNEGLSFIYDLIFSSVRESVPVIKLRKRRFPVWYDSELISLVREKELARKEYTRHGKIRYSDSYLIFSTLRKELKNLQKAKYADYISKVENSVKSNSKPFWSFIKNKRKLSSLPAYFNIDNVSVTSSEAIANHMNRYFESVFVQDDLNSIEKLSVRTENQLCIFSVTSNDVKQILDNLDITKAIGPDGIPGLLFKECSEELSVPLSILFNSSLESGVFPDTFKQAHIIPVYKSSGDKHDISNYRPISLLSIMAKVFEKVVYPHFYNHVSNEICQNQHGFVCNRSTATNLICFTDYVSRCFNDKQQVDTVYTDFSKAFDKVPHLLLLEKLKSYGINGSLINWCYSYLKDRSQRVVINGHKSNWSRVTSGVPQGSLLGPLFFILYINDLPSIFETSKCLLYADDAKIFRPILSPSDGVDFQRDLNKFVKWCAQWKLVLNVNKCFILSFTNKNKKVACDYFLNESIIVRKTEGKDLGIYLKCSMNYDLHVSKVKNKALQILGFIKRNCKGFKSCKSVKSLYCSMVRSIVEYCSPVWAPWQKTYIEQIESVQKRFIRYLCNKSNIDYFSDSYVTHLSTFNLTNLESRRKYLKLLMLHKCLHGTINCFYLTSQININVPKRVLRRQTIFNPDLCRINVRQSSFLPSTQNLYNSISSEHDVDIFTTYDSFKNQLRKILF